jgi:phenylpropionate dioxygenase-like ring-hydroxylating dioxygenase large terminal subunit
MATDTTAPTEPPSYPRDPRFFWFDLEYLIDAPMDLILENGLDCSHTGFAHEGLFRSAPSQFVTTRIEETATGVRATMLGEQAGGARDTRSRLGGKRVIQHIDEIVLPHTLKVDYRIGSHRLVTILMCTPETETRTRVFNRNGVFYGPWTPLVGRYVKHVAKKIVQQDVEVLNSQGECIRQFGGRDFRQVTADQPAVWMQRVLTRCARGGSPDPDRRAREIAYKL